MIWIIRISRIFLGILLLLPLKAKKMTIDHQEQMKNELTKQGEEALVISLNQH